MFNITTSLHHIIVKEEENLQLYLRFFLKKGPPKISHPRSSQSEQKSSIQNYYCHKIADKARTTDII